ncbi:Sir2 family NAD-dependent protein deacetylase [Microlunatus soli]|uniref:protein acetyllysine N-acetyltransferase n=1 Tax=Microlunatus soli TaxID=630515 RepID=A0A1H1X751_9ACTN|nr:Sir2 family NAD-dependent protein deacetylase [Microlunatus soli]SDT04891.1 NAD-dependent protein deacetylase, SIR2 family [Microlunatus soli]
MIRPTNLRFGADWQPSADEVLAVPIDDQLDRIATLLDGRPWTALTGAGISTDSGIPDYRGPDSPRATPMMYAEFTGAEANRQRYWARSFYGWQRSVRAVPNAGHRALAELAAYGLQGIITQNVDGLHRLAAGDPIADQPPIIERPPIIDLHGRIADVICLSCGQLTSRADLQDRLQELNPQLPAELEVDHAELRPDGDAVVEDWSDFVVAACLRCGGVLKPDVIFFGEPVPRDRVDRCYQLVDAGRALLVAGSSLAVMSGLRFVRHQAKQGKPVIIINRGATRGDEQATIKIDAGTTPALTGLAERLRGA